jgi:hypothetical protein
MSCRGPLPEPQFFSGHPPDEAASHGTIAQSEIAPTAPSPSGKRYDATEDRDIEANQR